MRSRAWSIYLLLLEAHGFAVGVGFDAASVVRSSAVEDLHQALQRVLQSDPHNDSQRDGIKQTLPINTAGLGSYLEFGDHRNFTELFGGLALGLLAGKDLV